MPVWFAIVPLGKNSARFLAEQRRDACLEATHGRIAVEHVVADFRVGHRAPHAGVGRVTVSLRRSIAVTS